jgi:hypothetical protein
VPNKEARDKKVPSRRRKTVKKKLRMVWKMAARQSLKAQRQLIAGRAFTTSHEREAPELSRRRTRAALP